MRSKYTWTSSSKNHCAGRSRWVTMKDHLLLPLLIYKQDETSRKIQWMNRRRMTRQDRAFFLIIGHKTKHILSNTKVQSKGQLLFYLSIEVTRDDLVTKGSLRRAKIGTPRQVDSEAIQKDKWQISFYIHRWHLLGHAKSIPSNAVHPVWVKGKRSKSFIRISVD